MSCPTKCNQSKNVTLMTSVWHFFLVFLHFRNEHSRQIGSHQESIDSSSSPLRGNFFLFSSLGIIWASEWRVHTHTAHCTHIFYILSRPARVPVRVLSTTRTTAAPEHARTTISSTSVHSIRSDFLFPFSSRAALEQSPS